MRYLLAVFIGKGVYLALKLLGRKATTTPGQIALKICPDVLKKMSKGVKKNVIAVFGTNGKTTTNNLLCDQLELAGYSVVSNRVGANMKTGVAGAFLQKSNWLGKVKADFACLEMDEAWAKHIVCDVNPSVIVVGNLFRDQLDRYGEIEMTMQHLKDAICQVPNAVIAANGDDPLVVATVSDFKNKKYFYGIGEPFTKNESYAKEGKYCYQCGKPLEYDYFHFNQLGAYRCECGFCRPELKYTAKNIQIFPKVAFDVEGLGKIELNGRGVYNIYNILGSMTGAMACGVDFETVQKCAQNYKPQAGRLEEFTVNGKSVYLLLSKNPAGFNQSVDAVLEDPRTKDLIVAVNDRPQDGQDVSWLWDVNFDGLIADEKVLSYKVGGMRYADMGLRFKYGGVPENQIGLYTGMKKAIEDGLQGNGETLYMLVNYTILFETQAILKEMSK